MNNPKKIAIIGASYLQLPLVEKALELGHEAYCFAYLKGAVAKDICTKFFPISVLDKEAILAVCQDLQIDGILTIASDISVHAVNYVADKMNLPGNPVSSTVVSTNKFSMKEALSAAGIRVAKHIYVDSSSGLNQAQELSYPLIVKPVDRSGSMGISKINTPNQLEKAFEAAFEFSFEKRVIIEEFIEGKELSIEGISFNGEHELLAMTDKVTSGAPHFVELEHHQPSGVSSEIKDEIQVLIPKALSALKVLNGASHSEIIITKGNQIYVNEIGARMGGDFIGSDLVELSTGYDYLQAVIEVALGQKPSAMVSKNKHAGVIFFSALNRENYNGLDSDSEHCIRYAVNGEMQHELTRSSDRHGYFLYQSNKRLIFAST